MAYQQQKREFDVTELTPEQKAQQKKNLEELRLAAIDSAKDGDVTTAGVYTMLGKAIEKGDG
jgi:hypothetical protein